MEPKSFFTKLYGKYRRELVSGGITFLLGMFVHLYVVTNKFFNYFEMGNIMSDMSFSQNDTLGLGRWFLPVATNLFTSFSLPLFNGIMLMGFLSAAAGLLCSLLHIRELWTRVLFGAVWVTFPGVASTFAFGVNSDAIALSVLLAVLAVYMEEKWKWGTFPGAAVLGLSVGIYQPFLSVAVGAAFCVLFRALLEQYDAKDWWKKTGKLLFTLGAGFVVYYGVLQLMLFTHQAALSDYHGVSDMTSFTAKGIVKGFVYSYVYFFRYFFTGQYLQSGLPGLLNAGGAVIFAILLVKRLKGYAPDRRLLLLLMTALIPLGVNATPFLMGDRVGNGVDVYMLYSMMFLWALLLLLSGMENGLPDFQEKRGFAACLQWGALGCIAAAAFSGLIICNTAYHRMEAMTQTTEALLARIVARMEQQPEWNKDMPVYFVNPRELVNDRFEVSVAKYDALTNLAGTELKPNYNETGISRYMEVYLHFPVRLASEEEKALVDRSGVTVEMESYPAADAVKVIEGVMVVKISDGE